MPKIASSGFVKTHFSLRPEQWQWLKNLSLEFAIKHNTSKLDVSAIVRGILDEFKEKREGTSAPAKKASRSTRA